MAKKDTHLGHTRKGRKGHAEKHTRKGVERGGGGAMPPVPEGVPGSSGGAGVAVTRGGSVGSAGGTCAAEGQANATSVAANSKDPQEDRFAKSGRRGARPARREERAYAGACKRRATPPAGMDRRPESHRYLRAGPRSRVRFGLTIILPPLRSYRPPAASASPRPQDRPRPRRSPIRAAAASSPPHPRPRPASPRRRCARPPPAA